MTDGTAQWRARGTEGQVINLEARTRDRGQQVALNVQIKPEPFVAVRLVVERVVGCVAEH